MFCTSCEAEVPEGARFCSQCGAAQGEDAEASAPDSPASEETAQAEEMAGAVELGPGPDLQAMAARPPDPFENLIGETMGGYQMEELLGKGSLAAVFRASHELPPGKFTVKLLLPHFSRDGELISLLEDDLQILVRLDTPHLLKIHETYSSRGMYCVVQDHIDGVSLDRVLLSRGRLPESAALAVALQAALGLWDVAQKGVVHRDIKPSNLLIEKGGRVLLTDFGLARAAEGSTAISHTGSVVGAPAYLAPEQFEDARASDHRTDLYALGCVLYKMLTGKSPFSGPNRVDYMLQHCTQEPPSLAEKCADVSPGMVAVVGRLLQKAPADRFENGAELAEALEALASCQPGSREQVPGLGVLGTHQIADLQRAKHPAGLDFLGLPDAPGMEGLFVKTTPVTQAEWERVMGAQPAHFTDGASDDQPVENVSWLEATQFCNKLSELEGLSMAYAIDGDKVEECTGSGYRLPSQGEWQYACRASGAARPATVVSAGDRPQPVRASAPNAWGLFAFGGNVWEWCADSVGELRVAAGGSWQSAASERGADARRELPADTRGNDLGLRPVRTVGS